MSLHEFLGEEKETPYLWDNMPEFHQPDNKSYVEVEVFFEDREDLEEFAKIIDQKCVLGDPDDRNFRKSIWHPVLDRFEDSRYRWVEDE
jgi:hypothetical protein